MLIANGAEVNAKNNNGYTPLHNAAGYSEAAVAKLLIDNGAEVNAKNKFGNTPLDIARKERNSEVAKLLADRAQAAPKGTEAKGKCGDVVVKLLNKALTKLAEIDGANASDKIREAIFHCTY